MADIIRSAILPNATEFDRSGNSRVDHAAFVTIAFPRNHLEELLVPQFATQPSRPRPRISAPKIWSRSRQRVHRATPERGTGRVRADAGLRVSQEAPQSAKEDRRGNCRGPERASGN